MELGYSLPLWHWSLEQVLSHLVVAVISAMVTAMFMLNRDLKKDLQRRVWNGSSEKTLQEGLLAHLRTKLYELEERTSAERMNDQIDCSRRNVNVSGGDDPREGPMAFLVGAGPGDPELLTLSAVKALERADLVITDRLVPAAILSYCKCRIVYSQKFKGCANVAQAQLQDWVVDGLKQGLNVVRLKGGDPFLYGRGMEEVKHILDAGFPVKVISGISSSLAAPLASGLSITARGVANKLMIATAHGKYDTYPDLPEFDLAQSTVYLMSVSRLQNLAKALIGKGYPSSLPVAVIERATMPEQRTVSGTLGNIGDIAIAERVTSPAVITIGAAAGETECSARANYIPGGVVFTNREARKGTPTTTKI